MHPPGGGAGAAGRVPTAWRLQDRRRQDHKSLPPPLPVCDSHCGACVARRRAWRAGAAGLLLSDEPGAGPGAQLRNGGVPADLLRHLRLPQGSGAAGGGGHHRPVPAGQRHDGLPGHFRPRRLSDQRQAVRRYRRIHRRPLCGRPRRHSPGASAREL